MFGGYYPSQPLTPYQIFVKAYAWWGSAYTVRIERDWAIFWVDAITPLSEKSGGFPIRR